MDLLTRLNSLRLTWWLLLGLVLWFALGSLGTSFSPFQEGLAGLNALLVRHWLTSQGLAHPWTLLWLLVLFFFLFLLAVNLIVCLWKRFSGPNKTRGYRLWIFLAVHILFGLVMLLHGLETVVGHKYPQQKVHAGEVITLSSEWDIIVNSVTYVNDPGLLRLEKHASRQAMTQDSFDIKANRVCVSLVHKDTRVHTGSLGMLQPLEYAGYSIVLRGFTFSAEGIGAKIKVVQSPFHFPFFLSYALFIASLIVSLLINTPCISRL